MFNLLELWWLMDSHDDLWIHMVSDMMMKPPKWLFFLWFQMNTVKVNENYNLHDWGTQEWEKNQEKRSQFLPRITAKIMKQATCGEKPSMGSWSKYQNLQFWSRSRIKNQQNPQRFPKSIQKNRRKSKKKQCRKKIEKVPSGNLT